MGVRRGADPLFFSPPVLMYSELLCITVCLSCLWEKWLDSDSYLSLKLFVLLGSPNLNRAWTWMVIRSTPKVRVIGQRSRPPGKKKWFQVLFDCFTGNVGGQTSHRSGSKVMWVKIKRSCGSRSNVTRVKASLEIIIMTSTLGPQKIVCFRFPDRPCSKRANPKFL